MKTSPLRKLAAFCILALGAGILIFAVSTSSAGQRDFISYWAAGQQLIHQGNPYDGVALMPLQRAAGLNGNTPNPMRNPPSALFLALPLGLIGSRAGLILWMLVLMLSLIASVRMIWILFGRRTDRLHLLSYCFAPVLACLMAGQLGLFVLLGVSLFLYLHQSRPVLAGAALLLCAVKPHLFFLWGLTLLVWIVYRRAHRILYGAATALLASCAVSWVVDHRAWPQYFEMMKTGGIEHDFIPTISVMFRILVRPQWMWLQFVPAIIGCVWALWYSWAQRRRWDWLNQGLLLLIISFACAPYAWFSDEAALLPAVLAALYRAEDSGRPLWPFGIIAGASLLEVISGVQMTTGLYVWTVPAWLAWYLYATAGNRAQAAGRAPGAKIEAQWTSQ